MKVLHGLDVVVGEAEPSEQVDVLQPFDGDQVVGGEVKNLVWIGVKQTKTDYMENTCIQDYKRNAKCHNRYMIDRKEHKRNAKMLRERLLEGSPSDFFAHLEMVQFCHLEHADQLVVGGRKLK